MLCVLIPELLKLIEQSPEMMRLYNRALSLAYKKLNWTWGYCCKTTGQKERYQYFVDTYQDLVDVVSKKDIASYLHLSPESLSRVLKSYKEEKIEKRIESDARWAEKFNQIKEIPVFIEESNKQWGGELRESGGKAPYKREDGRSKKSRL